MDRYAQLVDLLLEHGRFEDIKRSAEDATCRQHLFKEFDIAPDSDSGR